MFGDSFGFGLVMAGATNNDIFKAMGIAAEAMEDEPEPIGYTCGGDPVYTPVDEDGYDEWGNYVGYVYDKED